MTGLPTAPYPPKKSLISAPYCRVTIPALIFPRQAGQPAIF